MSSHWYSEVRIEPHDNAQDGPELLGDRNTILIGVFCRLVLCHWDKRFYSKVDWTALRCGQQSIIPASAAERCEPNGAAVVLRVSGCASESHALVT
jgi:hypothetical protein